MAKRDEQQRKLELLDQLSRQRAQITSQKSRLATQIEDKKEEIKEKINVPKRIKNGIKNNITSSFSSSPIKWFLGSAVGGLLVTKVVFGRKSSSSLKASATTKDVPTKVSKGLLATSLLYVAKPYFKSFLLNHGKTMLLKKFMPRQRQLEAPEYHDAHDHDISPGYRQL